MSTFAVVKLSKPASWNREPDTYLLCSRGVSVSDGQYHDVKLPRDWIRRSDLSSEQEAWKAPGQCPEETSCKAESCR